MSYNTKEQTFDKAIEWHKWIYFYQIMT
jgi:hypothetical protein